MNIKLIALDVDGTIRETGKPISKRTMQVVNRLKNSKIIILTNNITKIQFYIWNMYNE